MQLKCVKNEPTAPWNEPKCGSYAPSMTESGNLRIRLDPELSERFSQWSEAKAASKQATMARLLKWFLDQESLLQSMILGVVESEDSKDVAELLLKKMMGTMKMVAHIDTGNAGQSEMNMGTVNSKQPKRNR